MCLQWKHFTLNHKEENYYSLENVYLLVLTSDMWVCDLYFYHHSFDYHNRKIVEQNGNQNISSYRGGFKTFNIYTQQSYVSIRD